MATRFPGRSVEELKALEADIKRKSGGTGFGYYVFNVMAPAARASIKHFGEDPHDVLSLGYSIGTAAHCAQKIADMLDEFGEVDYS